MFPCHIVESSGDFHGIMQTAVTHQEFQFIETFFMSFFYIMPQKEKFFMVFFMSFPHIGGFFMLRMT